MSPRAPKAKVLAKPIPEAPVARLFRRKRAAPVARTAPVARGQSALDLSQTPVNEITLANLQPRSLIAPNFRAYELTQSELAARQGIPNGFANEQHLRAAIHLARQVLHTQQCVPQPSAGASAQKQARHLGQHQPTCTGRGLRFGNRWHGHP